MTIEAPQCIHHFILEPFLAKDASGTCKKCGLTRNFKGYEEDAEAYRKSKESPFSNRRDPFERVVDEVSNRFRYSNHEGV